MTHTTPPRKRGRPRDDSTARLILATAVQVCRDQSYPSMTCAAVALAAGVSPQLVSHYYTPDELRAAVCRMAIEHEILPIIAQAIAVRSPHVAACPADLRTAAIQWLGGESR